MDKVKIKRVKRNKKKVSTKEKVLAGLGLGSTLLGGVSAVTPKPQDTQFVRTQTNEEGTSTGKIKETLGRIFGVGKAQAYSDSGDAGMISLDTVASYAASHTWQELQAAGMESAFSSYFGGGQNASSIPASFNSDSAFAYALGWGGQTADQSLNGFTYRLSGSQWVAQAPTKTTTVPTTANPFNPTATPAVVVTPADPVVAPTVNIENLIEKATMTPWGYLSAAEQQAFKATFGNGQNADRIPDSFAGDSAFAYSLGWGGATGTKTLGSRTFEMQGGWWMPYTAPRTDSTAQPPGNTAPTDTVTNINDLIAKAAKTPWTSLSAAEQQTFQATFDNGQNANLIPNIFSADSAFAYSLGWGGASGTKTVGARTYEMQNGHWVIAATPVTQTVDPAPPETVTPSAVHYDVWRTNDGVGAYYNEQYGFVTLTPDGRLLDQSGNNITGQLSGNLNLQTFMWQVRDAGERNAVENPDFVPTPTTPVTPATPDVVTPPPADSVTSPRVTAGDVNGLEVWNTPNGQGAYIGGELRQFISINSQGQFVDEYGQPVALTDAEQAVIRTGIAAGTVMNPQAPVTPATQTPPPTGTVNPTLPTGAPDIIAKATVTPWQDLTPAEQQAYQAYYATRQNGAGVPSEFASNSAMAYGLGWGGAAAGATQSVGGNLYKLGEDGVWRLQGADPGHVDIDINRGTTDPTTATGAVNPQGWQNTTEVRKNPDGSYFVRVTVGGKTMDSPSFTGNPWEAGNEAYNTWVNNFNNRYGSAVAELGFENAQRVFIDLNSVRNSWFEFGTGLDMQNSRDFMMDNQGNVSGVVPEFGYRYMILRSNGMLLRQAVGADGQPSGAWENALTAKDPHAQDVIHLLTGTGYGFRSSSVSTTRTNANLLAMVLGYDPGARPQGMVINPEPVKLGGSTQGPIVTRDASGIIRGANPTNSRNYSTRAEAELLAKLFPGAVIGKDPVMGGMFLEVPPEGYDRYTITTGGQTVLVGHLFMTIAQEGEAALKSLPGYAGLGALFGSETAGAAIPQSFNLSYPTDTLGFGFGTQYTPTMSGSTGGFDWRYVVNPINPLGPIQTEEQFNQAWQIATPINNIQTGVATPLGNGFSGGSGTASADTGTAAGSGQSSGAGGAATFGSGASAATGTGTTQQQTYNFTFYDGVESVLPDGFRTPLSSKAFATYDTAKQIAGLLGNGAQVVAVAGPNTTYPQYAIVFPGSEYVGSAALIAHSITQNGLEFARNMVNLERQRGEGYPILWGVTLATGDIKVDAALGGRRISDLPGFTQVNNDGQLVAQGRIIQEAPWANSVQTQTQNQSQTQAQTQAGQQSSGVSITRLSASSVSASQVASGMDLYIEGSGFSAGDVVLFTPIGGQGTYSVPATVTGGRLKARLPMFLTRAGEYTVQVRKAGGAYITESNTLRLTVTAAATAAADNLDLGTLPPAGGYNGFFGTSGTAAAATQTNTPDQAVRQLEQRVVSMQSQIETMTNRLASQSGGGTSTVVVQNNMDEINRLRNEVRELTSQISQLRGQSAPVSTFSAVTQMAGPGLQMPNTQPSGLQMPAGYPASEGYVAPQVAGTATEATYTVKKGDTLWSIAKRHYGDGRKWRKILEANTNVIKNPRTLRVGTELVIPVQ